MLPKSKRLKRDDFRGLSKRNIVRGVLVDVAYFPTKESRFACIVQKKGFKLAVDRNKVKRKIYSAISKTSLKKAYIIIIYPKQGVLNVSQLKIITEIQSIFDTL